MNNKVKVFLKKFFIWRLKHINDKNFLLILSVLIGIVVGFAALLLKFSVELVKRFVNYCVGMQDIGYIYIFFPAIGILLTIIFINYILKRKLGHGIPMVLFAISRNNAKIPFHNIFSRIVSSSLTVGFGGSVGLEGPVVATGAAIGSNIGSFFRLNYRQIILLIGCAATAAIAGIFKAPITAIIFALEVIMLDLTTASLLPLLLSSISAALISFLFTGQNFAFNVTNIQQFNIADVVFYVLLGFLSGLFAAGFSKIHLKIAGFFENVKSKWIKFIIGSISLGLLIFLFPSLYGEGYDVINFATNGKLNFVFENTFYSNFIDGPWLVILFLSLILFFKIFAISATFIGGGVGGLFAPSLFLGSVLGLLFSLIIRQLDIDLPLANFALAGMAGVMSGVMHAPLTAIFLIAEITGGYSLFVPLMIVSAIAYFTARIFSQYSIETLLLAKQGVLLTHNADANMLTMLKLETLIEKNFLTINEEATLRDLTQIIIKSTRNIYVVVDEENNLKGIVWFEHIKHLIFMQERFDNTYVKDLMYMPDTIIEIGMSLKEIAEMFEETDNYNIPVINEGKYIGFISRAKLFSQYRNLLKMFSDD